VVVVVGVGVGGGVVVGVGVVVVVVVVVVCLLPPMQKMSIAGGMAAPPHRAKHHTTMLTKAASARPLCDKCTYLPSYHSTEAHSLHARHREFYFSVNNLCRDVYLRMRMSQEGWVPLHVLCKFNKMRSLTNDTLLIMDAIKTHSTKLEVDETKHRVRIWDEWAMWVFPRVLAAPAHSRCHSSRSGPNHHRGATG